MSQVGAPASQIHIATHPTRVRIAQELAKEKSLTVEQLKNRLPLSTELIAFHLAILESNELVASVPGAGNPPAEPRVVTYFRLTPKFRRLLSDARKLV